MEHQKLINLLDNKPDQPFKFRTKNLSWDKWWFTGRYNVGHQTRFESSMLRSSLCDYSDAYIIVYSGKDCSRRC